MTEPKNAAELLGTPGFDQHHLPYASGEVAGVPQLLARLGEHALPLRRLAGELECPADLQAAFRSPDLTGLLHGDRRLWDRARALLRSWVTDPRHAATVCRGALPIPTLVLGLPFQPGDYVDFYASAHHASNVGKLFRPGQPELPANWKQLPIGYHGRSGTIRPSGHPVRRPNGLRKLDAATAEFGPSGFLDIEAEIGFVLGSASIEPIPLDEAEAHVFGVVLVNDWSARDIQAFEYVPLGPFLGKSFATSIAAWVTPLAALDAARVPSPVRELPLAGYLDDSGSIERGLDLELEVLLNGELISSPPARELYYSYAQMLAHMTVNGASTRPGDFFASGTVSGPAREQRGSMLELSWLGAEPIRLSDGSIRSALLDGDEVVIRARAAGPDGSTIRLPEVSGRITA
ncbi:MAG: fumarylacetoacetate hydrolase family protein [Renibacterium sp.]|nr:fumarylacetoacetate hydrolase family protein [Renibacterium sp.]